MWLSAKYHLPSLYSIRVPLSSNSYVKASPAPGPGTVRLALVRTAIELFGLQRVKSNLFPVIVSSEVLISPPEKVSISKQIIHAYKTNRNYGQKRREPEKTISIDDGISTREYAHAEGNMSVYIDLRETNEVCTHDITEVLLSIGYWGQSSSFATCSKINDEKPERNLCGLEVFSYINLERKGFISLVTELKNDLTWDDVVDADNHDGFLSPVPYIWPMEVKYVSGNTLLTRFQKRMGANI